MRATARTWTGLGWVAILAVCCWTVFLPCPAISAPPATEKPSLQGTEWTYPAYITWLEKRSMLYQARLMSRKVSGGSFQWQHAYAEPQPREVVKRASVWMLAYPGAVITRPGESVIATWADPHLWDAFREIGIDLLHTGPVKRSGGITRKEYTPTIDGWFDRISLEIDPQLGTEEDYRRMVKVAVNHGGMIAGDLVPLHTGKGADFRLAQRAYKDYPGLYTMVAIPQKDWGILPPVEGPWESKPVLLDAARKLTAKGYIPGLIHSCDAVPNARELSGWDATGEVLGVDGQVRRWVYLHYFKPGQPTLNWLDPSSAAQRALAGDIVRTVHDLGARVIRFDAIPFLGIEREPGQTLTRHYQHPLSVLGTEYLAFLTRKMGGWSFQELNVPLVQLRAFTRKGPDLSYDFFTRTEGLHSLLSQDARLLRQAYGFLLEARLQPVSLVHDMQNHDEITYQLMELDYRGDDTFRFGDRKITGRQLREGVLDEMRAKAAGKAAPYNLLYRAARDGVATTYAGFVAASLGVRDLDKITPQEREQIRRGHLLLAWANAMQPGVFSLSSWDLVGALPLPRKQVAERMHDGDYRWVNRGGVDLMGVAPGAGKSRYGLPAARALYGPLPKQLKEKDSFASALARMLKGRKKYRIAEGELMAVPAVKNRAVCLLVMRLPGKPSVAITALNFSREPAEEEVDLSRIKGLPVARLAGQKATNVVNDEGAGIVTEAGHLAITLKGWTGKTLVLPLGGEKGK
jgi:trehalose synthase